MMSSVVPDVATDTPVAIGEAGACCCCWCCTCIATVGVAAADAVGGSAAATLAMRVTEGSRLGGTTGLLGGIGGGTPRPSGNAAGVFFSIVPEMCWWCCWWCCCDCGVAAPISLPACCGCCALCARCVATETAGIGPLPAVAAVAMDCGGGVPLAATLESLRGTTCATTGEQFGDDDRRESHEKTRREWWICRVCEEQLG